MSPLRPMQGGLAPGTTGERPRLLDHLRSEPRRIAANPSDSGSDAQTPPWLPRAETASLRRDELVLAALPRDRFVACYHSPRSSLTNLLARRCHHLIAGGIGSASAEPIAADPVDRPANVTVVQHTLPHGFPSNPFDLVVLGQFEPMPRRDATELVRRVVAGLVAGGVLVTLTSDGTGRPNTLHDQFVERAELRHQGLWEDPGFRLDLWLRS